MSLQSVGPISADALAIFFALGAEAAFGICWAQIQTFLFGFQMLFDKMATICLDFKWLGFWISDTIQNPDHLQTNLFLTI